MTELQAILKLMARVEELERELAANKSTVTYWWKRAMEAEGKDPETVSCKPLERGEF